MSSKPQNESHANKGHNKGQACIAERLNAGTWDRSLYLRRISTFRMTFRGLVLVSDQCHFIDCFVVSLRF
jgi:hypothetical protein